MVKVAINNQCFPKGMRFLENFRLCCSCMLTFLLSSRLCVL